MSFIKRWLPMVVISLCYLTLLRVLLTTIWQFIDIMTLSPLPKHDYGIIPENYGVKEIFTAISLKMWYASPEHVDFGDSVISELVETFVGCAYGLSLGAFSVFTWFLSTRVQRKIGKIEWWTGKIPRWIMFLTVLLTILLQFTVWSQLPIYEYVLPALEEAIQSYDQSELKEYTPTTIKNIILFDTLLLLIPVGFVIALIVFIIRKWKEHEETDNLTELFLEWQFQFKYTSRFFAHQEDVKQPDITLGEDVKTGEDVIQYGGDRNVNTCIIGPIGTGKTSALIIPTARQDLDYIVDYINNFADETDEDRTNRVNGMIVIEPSNDLCRKIYQLAKARNIPDEVIYYLNPEDKNTPSVNPIRGPIEKAVETFTKIVQGLAANSNEFFKQAQRSHLKHYVYLLKLAKQNQATFDDLMEMYQDARLVADYLEIVEGTIPGNWETIADRDLRNHWMIVRGIVSWFRERGLYFVEDKNGLIKRYPVGHKHAGKQMVVDKQAEFVEGLRNILDDISSSKLIRRVLFGNSDFDMDVHLKAGGILLVNTAKGELAELSNVFGKFMLMLAENGIFRRDSNEKDPYHPITVDEFPDYIYDRFRELPAQSRKYKVIVTVASQSLAQLALEFGDDYMYTLLSALRHKMVYGDVDPKTAEVFFKYFGEDNVYQSTEAENYSDSTMSSPGRRDSVTVTRVKQARFTISDLIHLKEFHAAVKLVVKKRSTPARVIKAKWVPAREFIKSKKRVDPKKAQAWLDYRRQLMIEMDQQLLRDMGILREGESNPKDIIPVRELEKLEAFEKKRPIFLDDNDKEAVRKLSDTGGIIPLNFEVINPSAGRIPSTETKLPDVSLSNDFVDEDEVAATADLPVPPLLTEEETEEHDVFASIYGQLPNTDEVNEESNKNQKLEVPNDRLVDTYQEELLSIIEDVSARQTEKGTEDTLSADIIKMSLIQVEDKVDERKSKNAVPLSPIELFNDIKDGE